MLWTAGEQTDFARRAPPDLPAKDKYIVINII